MVPILRRLGIPPDDTEDVLQNIFLEVWRVADRYAPHRGPAAAWLYAIMRRRAIDHLRRMRAPAVPLDVVEVSTPAEDPAVPVQAAEALAQLADRDRVLLELLYIGGFTQAEIARAWGIPLGTVKTWAFRAVTKLRRWDGSTNIESNRGEHP